MSALKEGDRVTSQGNEATVITVHTLVTVEWDKRQLGGEPIYGTWPARYFNKIHRKFSPGQFVRVSENDREFANEVGIIIEDDGDDEENMPYVVGIFDEDESENNFSASELKPWFPLVGERVVESVPEGQFDDEDVGTVVGFNDDKTARVLWDSFPHVQEFAVADLEPYDEFYDAQEFKVGDAVEYHSPFFAEPKKAVVNGYDGESLYVSFPDRPDMNGYYHQNFFSKAA